MDRTNTQLTPELETGERTAETSLRPRKLSEFIGQPKIKENLARAAPRVTAQAAP